MHVRDPLRFCGEWSLRLHAFSPFVVLVSCPVVARREIRASCRMCNASRPRSCSGITAGGKAVREDNVRPSLLARSRPSISCEYSAYGTACMMANLHRGGCLKPCAPSEGGFGARTGCGQERRCCGVLPHPSSGTYTRSYVFFSLPLVAGTDPD